MAAKPTMLTAEGLKKLEDELAFLQNEKRKEIAEKIKVARSFGDLSENSEYDDAKNEQAIMEARINTIEAILKTAVLIDESETSNERVHLTSVVKIEMLSTGRQVQYKIVGSGSNEANPKEGKISDESPIGAALMDKSVGDVVEVETPGGIVGIKILEITK
ncbi:MULTISPECIES: transcription elongation factor GreA [Ruminococcus]|jgi:transcription elongation factor GreA|uniref:Transcription elongation factor GreA n=1 Tax=Ruminococcus difficilis TaxID=2763069 RepID=A0A934WR50_9FIRM|nr:transcription elongation factor GreA [Ruminococcus difficilis]MBQ1354570.1 transcription elongation factor GreA [Ruminococcus sp.]MDO4893141.1 transcription elongation factor GreA [Eubacteriales bacterium]MBK6087919.1 transcription elongation factor GreA [Ruminococcus difficilis]MBQ1594581.1 transcription elongation factor GreA [Ruminococcus sp.]MBQ1829573.1 transcription elongation factor GreA [Ruminococcus sp.]